MRKSMYIFLILIGIVIAGIGVYGLFNSSQTIDEPVYDYTDADYDSPKPESNTHTFDIIQDCDPGNQHLGSMDESQSQINDTLEPSTAEDNRTEDEINKEKGNLFEGYVADCFKDRKTFTVLEWNQGVTSPDGVYAINNVEPDFHIQHLLNPKFKIDYYVEAKYYSHWSPKQTISFNDYQIDRYRKHQGIKRKKVLLAIGVGGEPNAPADFYIMPLDSLKGYTVSKATLARYVVERSQVKDYIADYFNLQVFPAGKEKKFSGRSIGSE